MRKPQLTPDMQAPPVVEKEPPDEAKKS